MIAGGIAESAVTGDRTEPAESVAKPESTPPFGENIILGCN